MRCLTPITLKNEKAKLNRWNVVPCGKCYACTTNLRNAWTFRLQQEQSVSTLCYFVTLTYRLHDGNVWKSDIQNFMKRLRKKISVRYYCTSEYSPQLYRPHYHILFFLKEEVNYNQFYKMVQDAWSIKGIPIGTIHVGTVTEGSIHYVTKFHINRLDTPDGLNPTFTLMSTKPAIGSNYVDKMKDYYKGNLEHAYLSMYGIKQAMPRYYKNKLYNETERAIIAYMNVNNEYPIDMDKYLKENPKKTESDFFRYLNDVLSDYQRKLIDLKNKKL